MWGRTLIVAAHPDDETLGLGGHFRSVHPRIFHLTTGAGFLPIPHLAEKRAMEIRRALAIGRIPRHRFVAGLIPDQGAVRAIPELVKNLSASIARFRPDCLLTHTYEGGHPDHDAASVICRVASNGRIPIYEFPSYHNGTPHLPTATFEANRFRSNLSPEVILVLSKKQQMLKTRMLRCFRSQAKIVGKFTVEEECFRRAPLYDYDQPPHEGILLYESFGWRMNFHSWRVSVQEALKKMGIVLNA